MTSAQDRVIAYCKAITSDTDPTELLTFCAEICAEDEALATAPISFFVGCGDTETNATKLVDAAEAAVKTDDTVRALIDTLKKLIGGPSEGGPEGRK